MFQSLKIQQSVPENVFEKELRESPQRRLPKLRKETKD